MVERKIIQADDSAPLISKKKKRQTLITVLMLVLIVVFIAVAAVLGTGSKIQKIGNFSVATVDMGDLVTSTEASGSVVLPTQVSIVSTEAGYADVLNVSVGDVITPTTILAELEVPELEQDIVDIENDLETQQISLEQILLSQEYDIKELEIDLERLLEDITEAEADVLKYEELKNLKSSRESDYEDAVDQLDDLMEQKEDLELKLEKTKRQAELDIRSKETQIKQNELDLERTLEDIEATRIKSPIAGSVLEINDDLSVPGSLIKQSSDLFTVANTSDVYIDLEVYEQYRSALEVGGEMEILISNSIIKAEITEIGSVASLSSDSIAATIDVRAKPIEEVELTMGASAVAEIPLGTKENALLLPRGAYLTSGNQKYLYVVQGNVAVKTEVVYGSIDGSVVEVLSGIDKGDKVIISSYQSFIDQDEIELEE